MRMKSKTESNCDCKMAQGLFKKENRQKGDNVEERKQLQIMEIKMEQKIIRSED